MSAGSERYFVVVDGQLYGPADVAGLRGWVAEGRLTRQSVLQGETSGARVDAGSLADLFPPQGATTPPPQAGYSSPPPPSYMSAPQPTPGVARGGFPVWGIVLLVIGIPCLCGVPVLAAILFPVFSQARIAAKRTATLSNLKQLGLCGLMYTNDYDGAFPPVMESADAAKPWLEPYNRSYSEICVSGNPDGGSLLGDHRLGGRSVMEIDDPRTTLMFYDSKPWPNDKGLIAYVDGHAARTDFQEIQADLSKDPFGAPAQQGAAPDSSTGN